MAGAEVVTDGAAIMDGVILVTVMVTDGDTHVMDMVGDTQVTDGDTQVMDGVTQVMDTVIMKGRLTENATPITQVE